MGESKPEMSITRIVEKWRVKYSSPAKWSTNTKYIVLTPEDERNFYPNGINYKNYTSFVKWIQKVHGQKYVYKVDRSKPYVIYHNY